jgi:succinoglycan biosynthesis protein ExoA
MSAVSRPRPLVSVILAVYNEAAYIERVVHSILRQSCPAFDLEVLAIDGKSTDGTFEVLKRIAESTPSVRLLVNERRRIPFAFNIGLAQARCEYICIFGSHTVYDENYISTCLNELESRAAIGCGGRVLTTAANATLQARLVAACLGSRFGSSSKSFRTSLEGYADTINYPVYRRSALISVGGYDEQLYRNEDNDINQRLRARGHRLYLTWKTSCRYFVQPTIPSLLIYAWNNGYWNGISVKKNASALALRHFVPGMFVLTCLLFSLLAAAHPHMPATYRSWAALPITFLLCIYFGVALLVSSVVCIRRKWSPALLLPFVFFSFHVAYGSGTMWAFVCNARSPEARLADRALQLTNENRVTNYE